MKKLYYFLLFVMSMGITTAQQIKTEGIVTDVSSNPLPGVQIIVKGTNEGTQTDFDGKFSIISKGPVSLVFSYIGYVNQEIKIKASSQSLHVILIEDMNELDEVVVVAYGSRKRSSITGAITRRKARARRKEAKLSKALQGKIVGVNANTINNANIRIRGANTAHYIQPYLNEKSTNESYKEITENTFEQTRIKPLSTFSIDVDKASYSNIRRMINTGLAIPKDAVKIEEMINYFAYDYEQPKDNHPFAIHTELGPTPWNAETKLVKIGIKGKEIPQDEIPASNLVFLIDVSGSMDNYNKLPLLKKSFRILVNQLREKDKVSIVVYAGAAGVVLKPTSGANKNKILEALDNLEAGGSTAGGKGIKLAYEIAKNNFKKNGNNRVILATDGDFNVGLNSDKDMKKLIEEKRDTGVFLTCLGFGMGNYKDSKLETLADTGNGNHSYIDTMQEAQRVLEQEFGGTMHTIAKDVKIQVEFNPNKVQAYRLIGYENRKLEDQDFIDDKKDAGELGSGHTVTALYEVIPVGITSTYVKEIPELKYTNNKTSLSFGDELLTVKFRYKPPTAHKSIAMSHVVKSTEKLEPSADFKFAASVAWFGMKIRESKFINNKKYKDIIALAENNKAKDKLGYRSEFIRLMNSYRSR